MRKAYDFTILNNGQWMVSYDGHLHGPYVTRGVALMAAKTAAMKAASAGFKSEIIETLENGDQHTLWIHDDSPFDDSVERLLGDDTPDRAKSKSARRS